MLAMQGPWAAPNKPSFRHVRGQRPGPAGAPASLWGRPFVQLRNLEQVRQNLNWDRSIDTVGNAN